MMSLTTQKHDYVFKSTSKRAPIFPRQNLEKACGSMDNLTIQKLSFPTPLNGGPPKSFKPIVCYKRPEGTKMDFIFIFTRFLFYLFFYTVFSENGK